MSETRKIELRNTGVGDLGLYIALAILFVAFEGSPDLIDAIVFKLTNGAYPAFMAEHAKENK